MGTMPYLAPEILGGEADWSPAADVYGLGCLAWELLTGEPPFPFGTVQEVVRAHRSAPVPRLRDRLPEYLQPRTP